MNENKLFKMLKILIFVVVISLLLIKFSQACVCDTQGHVTDDDCESDYADAYCLTQFGSYEYAGYRCACIPKCIDDDGICTNYAMTEGDDTFRCDENTVDNPADCCASAVSLDCNGDSICEIVDYRISNIACGACGVSCDSDESCYNGNCTQYCGDISNFCDPDEECVYGECQSIGSPLIINGCGDGFTNLSSGEQCDNGIARNGVACIPEYNLSCNYCTSSCTSATIPIQQWNGDGVCTTPPETLVNAFADCFNDGWSVASGDINAFSVASDGGLRFTGTSAVLVSDGLDLFAGKNYILSADVNGTVSISLNRECISNTTFTQIDCRTNRTIYTGTGNRHVSSTFMLPMSNHLINNIYYRNVSISIVFTGNSAIREISLKEDYPSSEVHYDSVSNKISTAGCCPITYCWDGVKCVDSDLWMNDAIYPPIWNNIFDSNRYNWTSGHVNVSVATSTAIGYRCVRYNSSIDASAEWTVSTIKYDWNFTRSGYCARDTDCYVGPNNHTDYGRGTSASCVSSGDFVTDKYVVNNGGNHYCYQGNWTTKSYFIATLLQNISENSPYILHCYDNGSILYNNANNTYGGNIISACVMARPFNLNDDTIITGIVLDNDTHYGLFVADLFDAYFNQYGNGDLADPLCTLNTSQKIPGGNFSTCIVSADDPGLYAYYESNYKYLIVSNKAVTGIVRPTFWSRIKNFFIGLFRSSEFTPVPYTKLEYATSYDKVYIMRTEDANVTALEEYTYDELLGKPTTLFYITYQGSNPDNNPINALQVFNIANSTRIRTRLLYGNYSYNAANMTQELVIQTDNKTGIWKYFTATLRFTTDIPPPPPSLPPP